MTSQTCLKKACDPVPVCKAFSWSCLSSDVWDVFWCVCVCFLLMYVRWVLPAVSRLVPIKTRLVATVSGSHNKLKFSEKERRVKLHTEKTCFKTLVFSNCRASVSSLLVQHLPWHHSRCQCHLAAGSRCHFKGI